MELNERKIETLEDVKSFIADVAWYFGIDIDEDDIEVIKSINIDFSIMHGAPAYWFEYENPENYDGNGDYIYENKINRSKKVVWDIDKDIDLCTEDRLLNGSKHRDFSDEELEKLQELETICKDICDDEGFFFADLVLEDAKERKYKEEMDAEIAANWAEDDVREANRLFYDAMDENDAWGNID